MGTSVTVPHAAQTGDLRLRLDATAGEVIFERAPLGGSFTEQTRVSGTFPELADPIIHFGAGTLTGIASETVSLDLVTYHALTCSLVCGDGRLAAFEECDDGARRNGDGCSAQCLITDPYVESEPNEDGSLSRRTTETQLDGNDFALANSEGPFDGNAVVKGAIFPAGDEDVYALTNPTGAAISVRLRTQGANGTHCPLDGEHELHINVRTATGTLVEASPNDVNKTNACGVVTVSVPAGETVYAQVMDIGDDRSSPRTSCR